MKKSPDYIGQRRSALLEGLRDGIPVALGYFAVSFSLGITAVNNGVTPLQSMITSLLCNSSSGEYAGFALMGAHATLLEVAIMMLIINARYILMACALSQRMPEGFPMRHRMLIGFDINDELFALTIGRPGFINPYYSYGIALICMPLWALGTLCGALVGDIMPINIVSAFSVALYGMFLAIIIPAARKSKIIAGLIVICFAASYAASTIPFLAAISSGTRIILLTLIIGSAAALLFPIEDDKEAEA